MSKELPIPNFFVDEHAGQWGFSPEQVQLFNQAELWRKQYQVKPSATDDFRLHLLLIDVQKDFCFPEGSLFVGGRSGIGAIEDNQRLAKFIYRNITKITDITTTMDTHFAYQIFSPSFWIEQGGTHPSPHTIIYHDEILSGKYKPNPAVAKWLCKGNYAWLTKQVAYYCSELEKAGKYELYLWPPHCIMGSDGHALAGVIHEARMFHSFVRSSQSWVEVKGGNPLTENYSVLRPEVLTRFDGAPLAQKNTLFIQTLLDSNAVVIAGQAASHCVKSSIDDLLEEIVRFDRNLAKKIYILTDCMSSVTVPDGKGGFVADFSDDAKKAQERFSNAGMHLVSSSTPIENWPELNI